MEKKDAILTQTMLFRHQKRKKTPLVLKKKKQFYRRFGAKIAENIISSTLCKYNFFWNLLRPT
jgi:hypothetical protein